MEGIMRSGMLLFSKHKAVFPSANQEALKGIAIA